MFIIISFIFFHFELIYTQNNEQTGDTRDVRSKKKKSRICAIALLASKHINIEESIMINNNDHQDCNKMAILAKVGLFREKIKRDNYTVDTGGRTNKYVKTDLMARAFTPKTWYGGFCLSSIEVQWGVERVGLGARGGKGS